MSKYPDKLYLIIDKNDEIVLDSQNRPTIYRSIEQLIKYNYKFRHNERVVVYNNEYINDIDDEILATKGDM